MVAYPIKMQGKPENKICVLHDITELKSAEAELRALFAAMTDVIIVYDFEGRYLKIAPTNPSNLSSPAADLLGKTVTELFSPDQAAFFLENIRHTLMTGELTSVEYGLLIDNKKIWFSALVSPLSSDSVIWVARDITEYKKAVAGLVEREARYSAIARSAKDALISADSAGNIIAWNQSAEIIFDYSEAEIIGQPLTLIIPPHHSAGHLAGLARMRAGGNPHVIGKTVELMMLNFIPPFSVTLQSARGFPAIWRGRNYISNRLCKIARWRSSCLIMKKRSYPATPPLSICMAM
jgi:PAS domain S-box-containing protein